MTRFGLRVTAAGKILAFLSLFLLFAAQNTGNNLLYLMASSFISGFIWSFAIGLRNLIGLTAEIEEPDFVFANQEAVLSCEIADLAFRNHYMIAFENDLMTRLDKGRRQSLRTKIVPPARGIYVADKLIIYSFYPVDLFRFSILLPSVEIFVVPEPVNISIESLSAAAGGNLDHQKIGREGDYWMQLPYQDGTEASLINWSISARSFHEWIVVKSSPRNVSQRLFFDFRGLAGERFEHALGIIAGFIEGLRRMESDAMVWISVSRDQGQWLSVKFDYVALMRWLAEVTPESQSVPDDPDIASVDMGILTRN